MNAIGAEAIGPHAPARCCSVIGPEILDEGTLTRAVVHSNVAHWIHICLRRRVTVETVLDVEVNGISTVPKLEEPGKSGSGVTIDRKVGDPSCIESHEWWPGAGWLPR